MTEEAFSSVSYAKIFMTARSHSGLLRFSNLLQNVRTWKLFIPPVKFSEHPTFYFL